MSAFRNRHIGPSESQTEEMLSLLKSNDLSDFIQKALPASILSKFKDQDFFTEITEQKLLEVAKGYADQNTGYTSVIGQGYYNTFTPPVILRNIFENPGWYTAYTPYQAEISQGRLEALINFQTMASDLTGMEISNSSLLDEGTAASEAAAMALSISRAKTAKKTLLVEKGIFPQTLTVLKTRMEHLGVDIKMFDCKTDLKNKELQSTGENTVFGVLAQSPSRTGEVLNLKETFDFAKAQKAVPIAITDLLFATVNASPGSEGAEIVVGTSQRFGIPLGFGGPHAAFLATIKKHQRLIPGRIIGVSKDSKGRQAYRLALQTREQHIRREKATSNICTAQVLLAVMASMYGVYHGPQGLKSIALKVKNTTSLLKKLLTSKGFKVVNTSFFDTLTFESSEAETKDITSKFLNSKINIRLDSPTQWGFSVDELWDEDFIKMFCETLDLDCSSVDFNSLEVKDLRTEPMLTHQTFNSHHTETQLMRYLKKLENKDFSLVHGMIPLGSCTMKLNAAAEMIPVSYEGFSKVHPFAPANQVKGYTKLIEELNNDLCKITGFSKFSFQPNSGAQGEYAGLLTIKKYHKHENQEHRNICLVPSSAHGTNPASAVLAGFKVVTVKSDDNGNIDAKDLQDKISKHKNELGAFMVTYPSTHGVFESNIKELCGMVHDAGGLVYMDGANMNALVGLSKPTELGMDVSHLNLHKTFCIPHGGGGPGVGPIGVVDRLVPHLPEDPLKSDTSSVSSAEFGSASILPISWAYIKMMGFEGLKKATSLAILNANYIANRLSSHFDILYTGKNGFVAHECIIDTRPFKEQGITVDDIAKRLVDYGFHAPTMSWPVAGTLMIEPTESESKDELDRFCDALISISNEIKDIADGKVKSEESPLKNAPHSVKTLMSDEWTYGYSRQVAGFPLPYVRENKFHVSVDRVDNAFGDRNLFCACPPISTYES